MALKFIVVFAIALLLLGLGANSVLRKSQHQGTLQSANQNSLKAIAQRAKAEGKDRVHIRAPIIDYAGVNMDLDEAIRGYTILVGQPLLSKSYTENDEGIVTWYRFRIVEVLSRKSWFFCYTCPQIPVAPKEMAINPNEFLIVTTGGSVFIDSVEVIMENPALPMLQSGKPYLLIVSLGPSGVATLAAGPTSIFRIDENQLLEPVSKNNYQINSQINQRFQAKLSLVKAHLQK